jgi:hypothetical protein
LKGDGLRAAAPALALSLALAGCESIGGAAHPEHTRPVPTATERAVATHPATSHARPTAVRSVEMSAAYRRFFVTMCGALSRHDASTIQGELPYYQYNSGLRYGTLGDGEGTTGDPVLLSTWLARGRVRCAFVTPDQDGHGTILTAGWAGAPGPWSLLEMDTFNGSWKINDFTFGTLNALYSAMQNSAQPVVVYRG